MPGPTFDRLVLKDRAGGTNAAVRLGVLLLHEMKLNGFGQSPAKGPTCTLHSPHTLQACKLKDTGHMNTIPDGRGTSHLGACLQTHM